MNAYSPYTLAELFALELPPVRWLVEGLIPQGAAILLTAREKAGKGLLSIDLCASVAAGEPFLDHAVLEGPVIYCAAEESIREVRERIQRRIGPRRDLPFHVLALNGTTDDRLDLDTEEDMQRLLGMVAQLEPVLVVIDVLREVHRHKEDSADEMAPLLRPLRQLAHQTDTTIIVNHHQNKGGTFRGSTAIRSAFDAEIAFSRTDDEESVTKGSLKIEGRHAAKTVVAIEFGADGRWSAAAPQSPEEHNVRTRILRQLEETDASLNANQIAEALGSVALKSVQNELSKMVQEEPAVIEAIGTPRKGSPRRYRRIRVEQRAPNCSFPTGVT